MTLKLKNLILQFVKVTEKICTALPVYLQKIISCLTVLSIFLYEVPCGGWSWKTMLFHFLEMVLSNKFLALDLLRQRRANHQNMSPVSSLLWLTSVMQKRVAWYEWFREGKHATEVIRESCISPVKCYLSLPL